MSDISGDIRYSAKELFARIDAKLDVIAETLTTKADHEALADLARRVDALEASENQRKGSTGTQKVILGVLVAIAGLLVPIVVSVIQAF